MTGRARGEHAGSFTQPWRPVRPVRHEPAPDGASPSADEAECPLQQQGAGLAWRRGLRWLGTGLALLACGAMLDAALTGSPRRAGVYPATPAAWFAAYMAAAVDDPGRVCDTLLAPGLAARYGHHGGGCAGYFRAVEDTPVVIERVVRSGSTAVIEVRHRRGPRHRTGFVLDRRAGGWQAVDVIA